MSDDPRDLDVAIGDAEARGDPAFCDAVLAPAFSMVRPDGLRVDDRAAFLAALAPGTGRRTGVESGLLFDHRVVVVPSAPMP